MRALIARRVANRSRAEELSQEVFLRVHRGLPRFRREARLSTWIGGIVSNLIADEHRPRVPEAVSFDEPTFDRQAMRRLTGVIDRAYDDFERRDRVQKAIARLPFVYRVLVTGHYLHGRRYVELAASLQMPVGTVKAHLHRAKKLLRDLLEREL